MCLPFGGPIHPPIHMQAGVPHQIRQKSCSLLEGASPKAGLISHQHTLPVASKVQNSFCQELERRQRVRCLGFEWIRRALMMGNLIPNIDALPATFTPTNTLTL